MKIDTGWTQMWGIQVYLTIHEAKLLAAAIRKGQNKLADVVKDKLEKTS